MLFQYIKINFKSVLYIANNMILTIAKFLLTQVLKSIELVENNVFEHYLGEV